MLNTFSNINFYILNYTSSGKYGIKCIIYIDMFFIYNKIQINIYNSNLHKKNLQAN